MPTIPRSPTTARPVSSRRGDYDIVRGIDGEPGDQPADSQEAADALDRAGSAPPAPGPDAGPERRPPGHVRALVSRPEGRTRSGRGGRHIAPGLFRSPSRAHHRSGVT